jgi:hypothetical protein
MKRLTARHAVQKAYLIGKKNLSPLSSCPTKSAQQHSSAQPNAHQRVQHESRASSRIPSQGQGVALSPARQGEQGKHFALFVVINF